MSYEISKICTCEIIDEKNPQRTVFRVIRVGKDGNYKNMDFETTLMIASELHTHTHKFAFLFFSTLMNVHLLALPN